VSETKTQSFKAPPEFEEEVEEYREPLGMNKSQALRRLAREGLRAERSANNGPTTTSIKSIFLQIVATTSALGLTSGLTAVSLYFVAPTFYPLAASVAGGSVVTSLLALVTYLYIRREDTEEDTHVAA